MSTPPGDQRQGSSTPPAPRGPTPTPPRPRRFGFGTELDPVPARGAATEHLPRLAGDEGALARACAVQPVLPPAGARRQGQGHHVQRAPPSRARSSRRSSTRTPSRRPGSETEIPTFADNTSLSKLLQSKGVIVNAKPLDTGSPVVAEPPALLRAHAPLRRAALLPHAASRERAERPRRVRPFAGSPVSAVR